MSRVCSTFFSSTRARSFHPGVAGPGGPFKALSRYVSEHGLTFLVAGSSSILETTAIGLCMWAVSLPIAHYSLYRLRAKYYAAGKGQSVEFVDSGAFFKVALQYDQRTV
jgi:hypothetical protein